MNSSPGGLHAAVGCCFNKLAVHMNFNDLVVQPQIYQEHCVVHTTHFAPDIKNTITIFHHLWQGFESADKPWLRYYFHSDKQSNIFYSSGFHLIAVSRHAAFHSGGSRKSLQTFKQAFSVIKSLISTPAFNPSPNTLYISNSWFDPLLNVKVKSWCYFLIN